MCIDDVAVSDAQTYVHAIKNMDMSVCTIFLPLLPGMGSESEAT